MRVEVHLDILAFASAVNPHLLSASLSSPLLSPSLWSVCVFFFVFTTALYLTSRVSSSIFSTAPFHPPYHLCSGTGRDGPIALLVRVGGCLPCRARLKFTDWDGFLLRPGVDSWDKAESKEVELVGREVEGGGGEKGAVSLCVSSLIYTLLSFGGAAPTYMLNIAQVQCRWKNNALAHKWHQSTLA